MLRTTPQVLTRQPALVYISELRNLSHNCIIGNRPYLHSLLTHGGDLCLNQGVT